MVGESDTKTVFQILPVKPTIEADFPKIQEIPEGGEFVLTAKVDGSPPPTAIWLFDGEPVQAGNTDRQHRVHVCSKHCTITKKHRSMW